MSIVATYRRGPFPATGMVKRTECQGCGAPRVPVYLTRRPTDTDPDRLVARLQRHQPGLNRQMDYMADHCSWSYAAVLDGAQ